MANYQIRTKFHLSLVADVINIHAINITEHTVIQIYVAEHDTEKPSLNSHKFR